MIISAAKASDAATELGVELSTLNPDSLAAAYRAMSKEHHPDMARENYNAEKWARISWAKEVLTRWLVKSPATEPASIVNKGDCRACGGTGRVPVKRAGFGKQMTLQCVMCNGSGSLENGGQRAHFGNSE